MILLVERVVTFAVNVPAVLNTGYELVTLTEINKLSPTDCGIKCTAENCGSRIYLYE